MAGYSFAFPTGPGSIAHRLYLRLHKQDISDAAMDRGHRVANSNGILCPKSTDASCITGKGDHKITAEEVFDAAFELSERDVFFAPSIHRTLGIDIPWSWNVIRPVIPEEDMGLFWNYTNFLKASLQKRLFKEGSTEFRDAMALGIYYYAVSPKHDFIGEWDRFAIAERELTALGWLDIRDFLKANGGVFTARGARGDGRPSVLESVEQGELLNIHMTMLLYSMLRAAGIPANFMQGKCVSTGDPSLSDVDVCTCVQVPTGKGVRVMNPFSMQSDAHYAGFTIISPRQMFGAYQVFLAFNSQPNEMRKYLELAGVADPLSPLVHGLLGMYWTRQRKWDEASSEIEQALMLAPKLPGLYVFRALLFAEKKEFDRAIRDATHAIVLSPSRHDLVQTRGEMHAFNGNWDDAIKDFLQACRMSNNNIQLQDSILLSVKRAVDHTWSNKQREALRKQFLSETRYNADEIELSMIRWHLKWKNGRPKTATVQLIDELQWFSHPEKYSEPVRRELHRMMALLPSEMREVPEVKAAIGRIP